MQLAPAGGKINAVEADFGLAEFSPRFSKGNRMDWRHACHQWRARIKKTNRKQAEIAASVGWVVNRFKQRAQNRAGTRNRLRCAY